MPADCHDNSTVCIVRRNGSSASHTHVAFNLSILSEDLSAACQSCSLCLCFLLLTALLHNLTEYQSDRIPVSEHDIARTPAVNSQTFGLVQSSSVQSQPRWAGTCNYLATSAMSLPLHVAIWSILAGHCQVCCFMPRVFCCMHELHPAPRT